MARVQIYCRRQWAGSAIAQSPGSGLIPIALGEAKRLLAHLTTVIPDRAMPTTDECYL
jgi:hypothetical protein